MAPVSFSSGLISGSRYLPLGVLHQRAAQAARMMAAMGLHEDDCIALLMRNDFACFEATLAASLIGVTAVPLNWHLTAPELGYILSDCDAKAVIAHQDLLSPNVQKMIGGRAVFSVATPKEITDAYRLPVMQESSVENTIDWDAGITTHAPWIGPTPAPMSAMFYTSGTTGKPKGVRRQPLPPHVAAAVQKRTAAAFGTDRATLRVILTGPLYHSAPNAYALSVVRAGGLLVLQPRFDAGGLLELIETHRATHLHMVPTMFQRLLDLPETKRRRHDLSSLAHVAHGAAPCPPDIKRRMIQWWGPVIHEYYAMTETGIMTLCDSHEWLAHPGSVGKAAEGVTIKIVGDAPGKATGEICVRSDSTGYTRYHGMFDLPAASPGDFVATGDVGFLDADGFLYLNDRKSETIISGGVNIYPAEIEGILATVEGVMDCAVFGLPDREYGERVAAMIACATPLDAVQIRAMLRQQLAGYKIPKDFIFVPHIPRDDNGKIRKRMLRDQVMQQQAAG